MKKLIEFRSEHPELPIPEPKPASLFIPTWYKKTPIVEEKVLTAKRCVPIIDALSSGYIISTPVDVYWDETDKENKKPYTYDLKYELISMHSSSQTQNFDIDESFDPQPWKWINSFHIKLPKGYSALFTHPVNRTDLPFYSFSGVVDADKHPLIINFPFVIKAGFKGVIPAGTPMIQVIPFKREPWISTIKDKNKPYHYAKSYEVLNPPMGWYKRKFWSKKIYQ